jgi:hypothetical protein
LLFDCILFCVEKIRANPMILDYQNQIKNAFIPK